MSVEKAKSSISRRRSPATDGCGGSCARCPGGVWQIEPFGSPREPDVDVGSRMISTTKAPGLPARPLLGTRNVTNVHVREHERQVLRGVDQLAHFRIRQCRGGADAPYLRAGNLARSLTVAAGAIGILTGTTPMNHPSDAAIEAPNGCVAARRRGIRLHR